MFLCAGVSVSRIDSFTCLLEHCEALKMDFDS